MHDPLFILFNGDSGWAHDIWDALLGGAVTTAIGLMWRFVASREALEKRIRALEDWRTATTGKVVELESSGRASGEDD